jgi:hypothetical protein
MSSSCPVSAEITSCNSGLRTMHPVPELALIPHFPASGIQIIDFFGVDHDPVEPQVFRPNNEKTSFNTA